MNVVGNDPCVVSFRVKVTDKNIAKVLHLRVGCAIIRKQKSGKEKD